MSVRRAQEEVDSREFAEWIAFDQLEPLGSRPIESILAQFLSIYVNSHLKEGVEALKPEDFMPWSKRPDEEPQVQAAEAMQKQLLLWNAALSQTHGTVIQRPRK